MAVKVTEAAREREAFRYDSSLLSKSIINDTLHGPDVSSLSSSEDPTLTALAQLGVLRLDGRRCMISIFDRNYQHIVAESTATTTLVPNEHQTADNLMLCGTAFPRNYGVCEHVLLMQSPIITTSSPGLDGSTSEHQELGELPVSVVPDLWADSRFDGKPYVGRDCGALRFYCGTPIRSRRGINIGVISVMGEQPRDNIDPTLTHFLRDISLTVMSYLEHRVSATSYRRNVRMVRGLGSLVEGRGSMSNWWLDSNPSSFATGDTGEGALNSKQQSLQRGAPNQVPQVPLANQTAQSSADPETPPQSDIPSPPLESQTNSSELGARLSSASATARTSSLIHDREDESISQLQELFARAANLAREAVEVEGALFLDAAIGSFGGLATQEGPEVSSESSGGTYSASSSAEETRSRRQASNREQTMCKILGFSQSETSSIDGDVATAAHCVIPEQFLRSVLRRYPDGTIFNFDENGALQSCDSGEDVLIPPATETATQEAGQRQRKKPQGRRSDREVLVKAFAGARSIALVPIWDSHKERWYAGGFVWTRTPTRIFSREGELSYLKAMGIIIMAQVSRINALRADKAKADVLGSLSHELRSPLHGVVLGIELLHDTDLTGFQEDVINTVETCGRTLMETMDHLLDFSKINYFTKQAKQNRVKAAPRSSQVHKDAPTELGMMSLFTDVSLDTLVEEVVESIFAGYSFQQSAGSWNTSTEPGISSFGQAGTMRRLVSINSPMDDARSSWPGGGMKQRPPVTIYLSIEHGLAWDFHTQPGAIRRIIMNLFGNALKYTTQGSIVVSLNQEQTRGKGRKRQVVFSISDSGKGISADYLRNHIFTPFSQENHLAPGTGLGMSLVKQIVHSLKGEIGVESQIGRGTMVKVILPLVPSRVSSSLDTTVPAEIDFRTQVEGLRSRSVCLVGFKDVADADYPLLDTTSLSPHPMAVMDNLCRLWLGLDPMSLADTSSSPPSMYIVTQDSMSSLSHLATTGDDVRPVLVICHHALAAHELTLSHPASPHFVFISQPPGPRKLAKVLTNIFSSSRAQTLLPSGADDSEDLATPRPIEHNPINSNSAQRVQEKDFAVATHSPGKTPDGGLVDGQTRSQKTTPEGGLIDGQTRPRGKTPDGGLVDGQTRSQGKTPDGGLVDGRTRSQKTTPEGGLIDGQTRPSGTTPNGGLVDGQKSQQGSLPARPSMIVSSQGRNEPPAEGTERQDCFLLVDDNIINLKILSSYMNKLKRGYDTAENGLEALEAYRQNPGKYCGIFMDLSMPIMDGLEATRSIRIHEQQHNLPQTLVVALTGLASVDTQKDAFASGVNLFLTKPVPLRELHRLIETHKL